MKILIKSREGIERMARNPFPEHTALISITDAGMYFAELSHALEFLLQVAFDDVDNDVFVDELGHKPSDEERRAIEAKYHMLTDLQAL